MVTLERYRHVIQSILTEHARIPYAHGEVQIEPVFDRESDRYLLMIIGRENGRRVHGCLVHVDLIDGKMWIQRDGTEHGIANELVEHGISKDKIILGFKSPELRKYTEFAVA